MARTPGAVTLVVRVPDPADQTNDDKKVLFPKDFYDILASDSSLSKSEKFRVIEEYRKELKWTDDQVKDRRHSIATQTKGVFDRAVAVVKGTTSDVDDEVEDISLEDSPVVVAKPAPVQAVKPVVGPDENKSPFENNFFTSQDSDWFFGFKNRKNPDAPKLPFAFVNGDQLTNDIAIRVVDGLRPVCLLGPTGTGKTTTLLYIGMRMGLRTKVVAATVDMEIEQVFGGYLPREGGTLHFQEGPVLDFYENGGLIIIDEFTAMKPQHAMMFQQINNNDAFVVTTRGDGYVARKHPDFRIAFTGNGSDYEGVYQLSIAQLNRPWLFTVDYPTEEREIKVLTENFPTLSYTDAENLVGLANDTRRRLKDDPNARYVTSLRDIVKVAESVTRYRDPMRKAVELCVLEVVRHMGDESETQAIASVIRNRFVDEADTELIGGQV